MTWRRKQNAYMNIVLCFVQLLMEFGSVKCFLLLRFVYNVQFYNNEKAIEKRNKRREKAALSNIIVAGRQRKNPSIESCHWFFDLLSVSVKSFDSMFCWKQPIESCCRLINHPNKYSQILHYLHHHKIVRSNANVSLILFRFFFSVIQLCWCFFHFSSLEYRTNDSNR